MEINVGGGPSLLNRRRTAVSSVRRRIAMKGVIQPTPLAANTATDLIGSILSSQEIWHSKKSKVTLKSDGSFLIDAPKKKVEFNNNNNNSSNNNNPIKQESVVIKPAINSVIPKDKPLDLKNLNPNDVVQAPMYNKPRGGSGNRGNFHGNYQDNRSGQGSGSQNYGAPQDNAYSGGRHSFGGISNLNQDQMNRGGGPVDYMHNFSDHRRSLGGPPQSPFRPRLPSNFHNNRFLSPHQQNERLPFNFQDQHRPRGMTPQNLRHPPPPPPLSMRMPFNQNQNQNDSFSNEAYFREFERKFDDTANANQTTETRHNEECDIYGDIETPKKRGTGKDFNAQLENEGEDSASTLAPPPDFPSGLMDFDEKSERDNDSDQELVIDDTPKEESNKNMTAEKYDPFADNSDSNDSQHANSGLKSKSNNAGQSLIPPPSIMDFPGLVEREDSNDSFAPPPSLVDFELGNSEKKNKNTKEPKFIDKKPAPAPRIRLTAYDDDDDDDEDADCPNFSIYSSETINVARNTEKELSSQIGPLEPPPMFEMMDDMDTDSKIDPSETAPSFLVESAKNSGELLPPPLPPLDSFGERPSPPVTPLAPPPMPPLDSFGERPSPPVTPLAPPPMPPLDSFDQRPSPPVTPLAPPPMPPLDSFGERPSPPVTPLVPPPMPPLDSFGERPSPPVTPLVPPPMPPLDSFDQRPSPPVTPLAPPPMPPLDSFDQRPSPPVTPLAPPPMPPLDSFDQRPSPPVTPLAPPPMPPMDSFDQRPSPPITPLAPPPMPPMDSLGERPSPPMTPVISSPLQSLSSMDERPKSPVAKLLPPLTLEDKQSNLSVTPLAAPPSPPIDSFGENHSPPLTSLTLPPLPPMEAFDNQSDLPGKSLTPPPIDPNAPLLPPPLPPMEFDIPVTPLITSEVDKLEEAVASTRIVLHTEVRSDIEMPADSFVPNDNTVSKSLTPPPLEPPPLPPLDALIETEEVKMSTDSTPALEPPPIPPYMLEDDDLQMEFDDDKEVKETKKKEILNKRQFAIDLKAGKKKEETRALAATAAAEEEEMDYVDALQKERQSLNKMPTNKLQDARGKITFKIGNISRLSNKVSLYDEHDETIQMTLDKELLEKEKDKDKEKDREKEKELQVKERDRERERDKDRERDRDRDREREKDYKKKSERDKDREKERDKDRERDKNREKERDKESDSKHKGSKHSESKRSDKDLKDKDSKSSKSKHADDDIRLSSKISSKSSKEEDKRYKDSKSSGTKSSRYSKSSKELSKSSAKSKHEPTTKWDMKPSDISSSESESDSSDDEIIVESKKKDSLCKQSLESTHDDIDKLQQTLEKKLDELKGLNKISSEKEKHNLETTIALDEVSKNDLPLEKLVDSSEVTVCDVEIKEASVSTLVKITDKDTSLLEEIEITSTEILKEKDSEEPRIELIELKESALENKKSTESVIEPLAAPFDEKEMEDITSKVFSPLMIDADLSDSQLFSMNLPLEKEITKTTKTKEVRDDLSIKSMEFESADEAEPQEPETQTPLPKPKSPTPPPGPDDDLERATSPVPTTEMPEPSDVIDLDSVTGRTEKSDSIEFVGDLEADGFQMENVTEKPRPKSSLGVASTIDWENEDRPISKRRMSRERSLALLDLEPVTPIKSRASDGLGRCRTPQAAYIGLDTEAISETDEAMNFEDELALLNMRSRDKDFEEGEIPEDRATELRALSRALSRTVSREHLDRILPSDSIIPSIVSQVQAQQSKRRRKKEKKAAKEAERNKENISTENLLNWKKQEKMKERQYREKRSKSKDTVRSKRKSQKKKEKRRAELPRYNVRQIISEKPRLRKDSYGRDIRDDTRSRSLSISRSRSPRSQSRSESYVPHRSRSYSPRPTQRSSRSRQRAKSRSYRSLSRGRRSMSPRHRDKTKRRRSLTPPSRSRKRTRSPITPPRRRRQSLSPSPATRRKMRRISSSRKRHSRSRSKSRHRKKAQKARSRTKSRGRKRSLSKSQRKRSKHAKRSKVVASRSRSRSAERHHHESWEPHHDHQELVERAYVRDPDNWVNNAAIHQNWTPSYSRSRSRTPIQSYQQPNMARNWSPPETALINSSTQIPPKNLKVILTNKDALVKKKKKEKKKEGKKKDSTKRRNKKGRTPPPSKEVFASGDNILVSVCFNKENEPNQTDMQELPETIPLLPPMKRRRREPLPLAVAEPQQPITKRVKKLKERKHTSPKPAKKKEKKQRSKAAEIAAMKKPMAIIDLDQSPFREQTPSPKDVIVLSDDEEKQAQAANAMNGGNTPDQITEPSLTPARPDHWSNQGPKTPPEPTVKFSISKQPIGLRPTLMNPLLEEEDEEEGAMEEVEQEVEDDQEGNAEMEMEEEMEEEQAEEELEMRAQEELESRLKIGPNTPPEPPSSPPMSPDAYDPFDPTKSRSPTPEAEQEEGNEENANQDSPGNEDQEEDESVDGSQMDDQTNENVNEQKPTGLDKPKIISMVTIKRPSPAVTESMDKKTESTQTVNEVPIGSSAMPVQLVQQVLPTVNSFPTINPVLATVAAAVQRSSMFNNAGAPVMPRNLLQPTLIGNQMKQHNRPTLPNIFANSMKSVAMRSINKTNINKNISMLGQNGSDANIDPSGENIDLSSPYSPGSSLSDGLFDPPSPAFNSSPLALSKKLREAQRKKDAFDALFNSSPIIHKNTTKVRMKKLDKDKKRRGTHPKVGVRIDENQLQILDDLPSSAVEMQVKDKFLKKLNRQERVVEEVKLVLKPHYTKKHVTKEEYKDIMRKAVPKICHNKSGEINPKKIANLIEAYVKVVRSKRKSGTNAVTNNKKSKTLWS